MEMCFFHITKEYDVVGIEQESLPAVVVGGVVLGVGHIIVVGLWGAWHIIVECPAYYWVLGILLGGWSG